MEFAFKKFSKEGISQVTMDDLARGVGMGKGTLYKYFPSKEILLSKTVDFVASHIEKEIDKVLTDEKQNPVEKLRWVIKSAAEKLSSVNPAMLYYLERSMPEVYEKIEATRERLIMKNLVGLFAAGKKEGFFDPEMDEVLITHMIIGASAHILEGKVFATLNHSFDQLLTSVTSTFLKGCLTQKGRRLSFPEGESDNL
jgi:AcrR family transcriptional regulator